MLITIYTLQSNYSTSVVDVPLFVVIEIVLILLPRRVLYYLCLFVFLMFPIECLDFLLLLLLLQFLLPVFCFARLLVWRGRRRGRRWWGRGSIGGGGGRRGSHWRGARLFVFVLEFATVTVRLWGRWGIRGFWSVDVRFMNKLS